MLIFGKGKCMHIFLLGSSAFVCILMLAGGWHFEVVLTIS